MDKKLNDFLVEEIKKGIESLEKDKSQYEEEKAKLEGRDGVQWKEELDNDIAKIDSELKLKEVEIAQVDNANEIKKKIEAEEKTIEEEYQRLLKQKEQCEAELVKLDGRLKLKDGVFVPTREQEEYKRELDSINGSISRFDSLKKQYTSELKRQEDIVENLYNKYSIREKYKVIQEVKSKQEIADQEDKMWEEYRKEQEKEIDKAFEEKMENEEIEEMRGTYQAKVEADEYFKNRDELEAKQDKEVAERFKKMGKTSPVRIERKEGEKPIAKEKDIGDNLKSINCAIENGKLKYVIEYEDRNGEIKIFSVDDVMPHKMDKQEEESLKQQLEPEYFHGVDIEIVNMLSRNDLINKSNLAEQYITFVNDMIDGKDKFEDDITITYNLEQLRKSKLTKQEKRLIKKIAKNGKRNEISEYIKPKSRIKEFFERFTQGKLTSGEEKEVSVEQKMVDNMKDLAGEEGFDINLFIKQQEQIQGKEFSLKEKNEIIQQYGKEIISKQENVRNRLKVKVPGLIGIKKDVTQQSEQKSTSKDDDREPGDD